MRNVRVTALALALGLAAGCAPAPATKGRGGPTTRRVPPKNRALFGDVDRDGIPNAEDRCPHKPETHNGYRDEDGCPDRLPFEIQTQRIRLLEPITFVGESAALTTRSRQILNALAKALHKRPKLMLVEIISHTQRPGAAAYNLRKSRLRAAAVQRYLVRTGGISRLRLTTTGYGETRPLCKQDTPACHRKNDRIELAIVWRSGQRRSAARPRPAGPNTGPEPRARGSVFLPARHAAALTRSAETRLRLRRIRKLYEQGLRLLKQRRYTAAFQRFRTVVRDQPNHLAARLKLGVLQARLGDHAGANETVRWVRKHIGDDAADKLRKAQLKAMAARGR